MEKVTYIIPLHKYNKKVEALLIKAIESVNDYSGDKICIVGQSSVIEKSKELVNKNLFGVKKFDFVVNDGATDFCSQVNKAVFSCTTPYFSILEYDDTYYPYWNKVAQEYAKVESASLVLPIVELKKGDKTTFGNEIVWSPSFTQDEKKTLGIVNESALELFMDFNVTGALIRTEDFISVGGLKPSMKIAAWYEFLLRACYNSLKVYVAPKIGYVHEVGREGLPNCRRWHP